MHTALWVLAATSVIGAGVSMLRPRHDTAPEERRARGLATSEAIAEEIEATP